MTIMSDCAICHAANAGFRPINAMWSKVLDGRKLAREDIQAARTWLDYYREWADPPDPIGERLAKRTTDQLRVLEHAAFADGEGMTISAMRKRDWRAKTKVDTFDVVSLDALPTDTPVAAAFADSLRLIVMREAWECVDPDRQDVLVDLADYKVKDVAAKHGVSERTIRRWRSNVRAAA